MPKGNQYDHEARSTAKITQDPYLTSRRDGQAKSRGDECTSEGGSKDEIGSRGDSSENGGKITTPRKTIYPPRFRMAILGTSTDLRQSNLGGSSIHSFRFAVVVLESRLHLAGVEPSCYMSNTRVFLHDTGNAHFDRVCQKYNEPSISRRARRGGSAQIC